MPVKFPVPYQAVILAAGRGSRLAEHTQELPKALLPIGPRSLSDSVETNFLRRQVEILDALGVSDIVIVVGILRDRIEAAARTWPVQVRLVTNPTVDSSDSGSLHSFQFAIESKHGVLDGSRQTLLMDGDIVYDRRALQRLLDSPAENALLLARNHGGDTEEVCVYGTEDQPRFLGKGLTPTLVGEAPCLGEATGIVKFAPHDHALVRELTRWFVGDPTAPAGSRAHLGYSPAKAATEHEELTQRLMHLGRMQCVSFGQELAFMECDNAAEYAKVRDEFYPALLRAEASQ